MWIVDTSVWIDYFNGSVTAQTDILHNALGQRDVGLGDIILSEILQGFRPQKDFDIAQQALLQFPIYNLVGTAIAIKSAENFRFLRKQGLTIRKTIGCLIATFVIENDFSLLHNDRDFDHFERLLGLTVVR